LHEHLADIHFPSESRYIGKGDRKKKQADAGYLHKKLDRNRDQSRGSKMAVRTCWDAPGGEETGQKIDHPVYQHINGGDDVGGKSKIARFRLY